MSDLATGAPGHPGSVPDHVARFWWEIDARFADVAPTGWGAVVTDGRFPAVWDANYARLDVVARPPSLQEVEEVLRPALAAAGATVQHLVAFDPAAAGPILVELAGRGHAITHDLVMERIADPTIEVAAEAAARVDDVTHDPALWTHVGSSLRLFGADDDVLVRQLAAIERDVLTPGGKRWFGVRDDAGGIAALGAVTTIDDVAYLDNVATFEAARGRGYASAVTSRIVQEAGLAGVPHVCLFADPGAAEVVRMYERLGFRAVGELAASRGPVASAERVEPLPRA